MELLHPVRRIEVKRTFVIANLVGERRDGRKRLRVVSGEDLALRLARTTRRVLAMKESQLDRMITREWDGRRIAYDAADWYVGEFSLGELGVWKRAGGLPLAWTSGSLAGTVRRVKAALARGSRLLRKRSRHAIPGMLSTDLGLFQREKYLLPIVFKGGTGTMGRRGVGRMRGDIDDGCMRSVALGISGVKKLRVYVGMPARRAGKGRGL